MAAMAVEPSGGLGSRTHAACRREGRDRQMWRQLGVLMDALGGQVADGLLGGPRRWHHVAWASVPMASGGWAVGNEDYSRWALLDRGVGEMLVGLSWNYGPR